MLNALPASSSSLHPGTNVSSPPAQGVVRTGVVVHIAVDLTVMTRKEDRCIPKKEGEESSLELTADDGLM